MIIKDINIISFGKLKNKKISFSDNLNVIYGRNESGKTTVSAFIEAMFYSFPPRSDRNKYLPWDNSTAAGEMTVSINGTDTTLYRKFAPQPKGDVLEPKGFSFKGLIPPDRESYRKSSYSQEGKMGDFGTTGDIDPLISNLLSTGDENVNATDAVKRLEKLRRSLNSGNKLKEYDNKISQLEDEYTAALNDKKRTELLTDTLNQKKLLLSEYENEAEHSEKSDNTLASRLDKIDTELKNQAEYISNFPTIEKDLPEKPKLLSRTGFFYIICSLLAFFALFFIKASLIPLALLPILVHIAVYGKNLLTYKADLKSFFARSGCADEAEYISMLRDKDAAKEYYNSLLKEKSDLVTESSLASNSLSDSLYKKIIDLKKEIEALYEETKTSQREPSVISQEITYYRNLRLELSGKLEAVRLAIEAINYARGVITTDFTPKVTGMAAGYLNLIAPKDGREISLSSDMTVSVSDPVRHDISSQSFGFREELYLCFRIAWSDFLFGTTFPLILDDPFLGSDDYRENLLIDLLFKLSRDRQIIIFTNRKNERFNQIQCNYIDITPSDVV